MSAPATGAGADLPAAGSSFYLGMRILPRRERDAMYAIYAFCRVVDDIADSPGPRDERRAALVAWRQDVDALFRGEVKPATAMLAPHVAPFGLVRDAFHDVIDGMEMDLAADIQAPSWSVLDLYCDRVASAVGRLSARVFGLQPADADLLAHHLGRALQLTNILRDLDEDAAIHRLYLPREELQKVGMTDLTPDAVLAHPRLGEPCLEVARRAAAFYDDADRVMSRQRRRTVRAPRLMEAAYRSVLDRLVRRGFTAPRTPVRKDKLKIVRAVIRYGLA